MSKLTSTRSFRLPFLGVTVETYSARPAGPWFDTWTEGSERLAWMGSRLVILN